jgi:uncharacterized protein (DUF736 family)
MTDYDNTNTGALFKRDKEGNEKRPDYSGPANVDGTDWEVAVWIRESKAGNKYMSMKFSPPFNPEGSQKPAQAGANLPEPEDIPF